MLLVGKLTKKATSLSTLHPTVEFPARCC